MGIFSVILEFKKQIKKKKEMQKIKKIFDKIDSISRVKKIIKKPSVDKEEIFLVKKKQLSKEDEERLNSEFYWEQLQKIHSQNDDLTLQTLQEIRK
jgi:hypothetical protein